MIPFGFASELIVSVDPVVRHFAETFSVVWAVVCFGVQKNHRPDLLSVFSGQERAICVTGEAIFAKGFVRVPKRIDGVLSKTYS